MVPQILEDPEVLDFAVVGAGVAGAYFAWRAVRERPRANTLLFEATGRAGGRLLSLPMPLPGNQEFNAELGGMRYTNRHLLFRSLVPKLGLEEAPFSYSTGLMFLRNRHLRGDPPRDAQGQNPYQLDGPEQQFDPYRLVKDTVLRTLAGAEFDGADADRLKRLLQAYHRSGGSKDTAPRPKDWERIRREAIFEGLPLHEIGFWNLLQHTLSSEGFLFVHDGLGYESVVANWNAGEAMHWYLADFDADYFTVREGMSTVPETMADEVRARGRYRANHRLAEIEHLTRAGQQFFRLTFEIRGSTRNIPPRRVAYLARRVVLAMPKAALRTIRVAGFAGWDEEEWRLLLDSVTAHAMFKAFLAYEQPWWAGTAELGTRDGSPILEGRAVTDLPLRQTYYFAPAGAGGPGVLMASYSDEHYVDFWRPVLMRNEAPHRRGGDGPPHAPDVDLDAILANFGVTERMVSKVDRQLRSLHPSAKVPEPLYGYARDWSGEGGDGCWHSWNPRTRPWEVIPRMRQPLRGLDLFVCGEAYSCEQAWAEGALRSAEAVLQHLGFPAPKWIRAEEFREWGYDDGHEYANGT